MKAIIDLASKTLRVYNVENAMHRTIVTECGRRQQLKVTFKGSEAILSFYSPDKTPMIDLVSAKDRILSY